MSTNPTAALAQQPLSTAADTTEPHSIVIDATTTDDLIDWRILTTVDVSGGDAMGRVDHGIGRAWGTTKNQDVIETNGRVLGIRLGRIDPQVTVTVDGGPVNPHILDPGGVLGGAFFGLIPEDMRRGREDYDVVVSDEAAWDAIDWTDGLAVGIDADLDLGGVHLDHSPIDASGVLLGGIPTAGRYPVVRFPENRMNGWGHCALPLKGDFNRVMGLVAEGECTEPIGKPYPDETPRVRGIESRGFWNLVDHCTTRHWSFAGLSDRGRSTEFLNCTSTHNQQHGLGYGIVFSGNFDAPHTGERLATDSDEWIKLDRRRREIAGSWIDRGRALRCFTNACRHGWATGGDPNVEIGYSMSGSEARWGHIADAHRPGDVRGLVHNFTISEVTDGPGRPVTQAKNRGTPLDFYLYLRGVFENGVEPDRGKAADPSKGGEGTQAIEQVCIGGLTRGWWREEARPFERVDWEDVHFGDVSEAPYAAPPSGPAAPHEIVIEAQGESCHYGIEVSEGLFYGAGATPGDEILRTASRGDGAVGGTGADSWLFTGDLVGFAHEGPCEVRVDGEQIDPSQFADEPQDPTPGIGKDDGTSLLPDALRAAGIDPNMTIAEALARAGRQNE